MAASITKVGKKFRVTYEYGVDPVTGKRIRNSETFSSEREAKRAVNDFNYKQQNGKLVSCKTITIADLLQEWFNNYVKRNCEDTTAYGYSNIINKHLIPRLGAIQAAKLTARDVQAYYTSLQDEASLSSNTVRKHHDVLRKALQYGKLQHYVNDNVTEGITLPKKKSFIGESYTIEQLKRLLEYAKGTHLELPIYLAGHLGLRREEVSGLKWKHIDFARRLLSIEEVRTAAGAKVVTKGPKSEKSRRTLYISDPVYEVLLNCQKKQAYFKDILGSLYNNEEGFVYTKDDGSPYRINSLSEQFTKFLKKHDMPKIRFHDLRHTFCSLLYEAGVDLKSISEALGHADIGTTSKIYTHLFDKTHKATVNKLSMLLKDET